MDEREMKEIYDSFTKLSNDSERWKFILENQDKGITVYCDTDSTVAVLEDDDFGDYNMDFNNYIGSSKGIFDLLVVVGIKADRV